MHHPINLPVQFEPVMTFARMPHAVGPVVAVEAAIIRLCTAQEEFRAGYGHADDVTEAREAFLREVEELGGNRDSFSEGVA